MKLLTKALRAKLPPIYASEKLGLEAKTQVKFFTPDAQWTWYASEFDGKDLFFGLAIGFCAELGYFRLSELKGVRGALGLSVERDLYFKPTTLRELMEHYEQKGWAV